MLLNLIKPPKAPGFSRRLPPSLPLLLVTSLFLSVPALPGDGNLRSSSPEEPKAPIVHSPSRDELMEQALPFNLPEGQWGTAASGTAGRTYQVHDSTYAGEQAEPTPGLVKASRPQWDIYRNQDKSTFTRLKRAELLSLASQLAGYLVMDVSDVWKDPNAPPGTRWENLKDAWRTAPTWDDDGYGYNYIGHPYTGAFTYNLMRSQGSSALTSWLFSYSQSLIWEYTLEATVEHPSIQDMLITPNVGSLLGEGIHRLTGKMRENGLSRKEKLLITILNPGYVLNNGYH